MDCCFIVSFLLSEFGFSVFSVSFVSLCMSRVSC